MYESTGSLSGDTKEAFAGGVAEHLIQLQNKKYNLFFASSTISFICNHWDYKPSNYKIFYHLRKC